MAGVVARVTPGRILGLYAAIAAVLPAAFWLVRDRPESWPCGESEPPGHAAELDAFRAGAIPLHAVAALLLLAALCAWSARRNGGEVGGPTGVATAVLSAYLAAMLAWNDAFAPLGFVATVALVYLVTPVTLLVLALVAAFRPRAREAVVAALGWVLLVLGLPLNMTLIVLQGDGPLFC